MWKNVGRGAGIALLCSGCAASHESARWLVTTDVGDWAVTEDCNATAEASGEFSFPLDVVETADGDTVATENRLSDVTNWYQGTRDGQSWTGLTSRTETNWDNSTSSTDITFSLDESGDEATGTVRSIVADHDADGVEMSSCEKEIPVRARKLRYGRALTPSNAGAPDGTWLAVIDLAWTARGATCSTATPDFAGETGTWLEVETDGDRAVAQLSSLALDNARYGVVLDLTLDGLMNGDVLDVTEHFEARVTEGTPMDYSTDITLRIDFADEPVGTYSKETHQTHDGDPEPSIDCTQTWSVRLMPLVGG